MRRKIPSTAALSVFEAAARHQSFTLAGDELALTQSAVGRQIANLEAFLGIKLFRRTKRGVILTPAGERYSKTMRNRLNEVERDTIDFMAQAGGGAAVDLGVVPTFATHWLIPRLPRFLQTHPQVTIHLHSRSRPFLFAEERLDAAIYAGPTPWPGTESVRLMPEPMQVVCSPRLLGARKRLSVAQLAELPLIQMSTRPYAWRDWFQSQSISAEQVMTGPRVELFSMAVQAAVHGMGVALVPQIFVEHELDAGALISPTKHSFLSGRSYFLVYPEHSGARRELAAFGSWLAREAELDAAVLTAPKADLAFGSDSGGE